MALKTLQKIYEGADLSVPNPGVMYFRIEENCTIKEILIYADSPISADAVFNCKLGGSDLFSGASRPKILSGEESVLKTGLAIVALKGDKFVLSLDSLTGTIDAPLVLLLTVDDGLSSGGGSLTGDVTGATSANIVEKIQNRQVKFVPLPATFSDDFPGSALNLDKWERVFPANGASANAVVSANHATFYNSSDNGDGFQTIAFNLTGKYIKFGLNFPNGVTGANFTSVGIMCGSTFLQLKFFLGNPTIIGDFGSGNITLANWAFVRFSSVGSTVTVENSPDGINWTAFGSASGQNTASARIRINPQNTAYPTKLSELNSNITLSDALIDGSLMQWNAMNNRWQPIALTDLKAALNALP